LGKFLWVLQWKMLAYVMAIWSILRPFSVYCGHLVYFSCFGMLYQEKCGNPAPKGDIHTRRERGNSARRVWKLCLPLHSSQELSVFVLRGERRIESSCLGAKNHSQGQTCTLLNVPTLITPVIEKSYTANNCNTTYTCEANP
jgi:hypothetical protein